MLGGPKLKKIFQQYSPPIIEKRVKEIYNSLGRFRIYFVRRRHRPPQPTYLQIEPTIRCNIACMMCQRQSQITDQNKAPDISASQFKFILNKIPSANFINLQGNGEPFLNKDIIEMIETAHQSGKYTLTSTNGTLLDSGLNQGILSCGLDKLIVSFGSGDKLSYEKIMCGAQFQKATDNIYSLVELKRKKSLRHPKIILTAGFLKINLSDLIKLIDLSRELGADGVEIGPYYKIEQLVPDFSDIIKALRDIEKQAAEKNVRLYADINHFRRIYRARECLWPWQGVYITVKGDIKPCCSRAYFTDSSFGNIYTDDFNSIWRGIEYRDFRNGLAGRGSMPFICKGCPWD